MKKTLVQAGLGFISYFGVRFIWFNGDIDSIDLNMSLWAPFLVNKSIINGVNRN